LRDFSALALSIGYDKKIYFEAGIFKNKLSEIIDRSKSTIVVTSKSHVERGTLNDLLVFLGKNCVGIISNVESHPTFIDIKKIASDYVNYDVEEIIAIGGGSVIDTAKTLSKILSSPNKKNLADLSEQNIATLGAGRIGITAVPTTSGTGSEVTPFATLWNFEEKSKYSISGEDLQPNKAVLDSSLTFSLPLNQTLESGLDTISHAFDSIWNVKATQASINISQKSLELSLRNLIKLNYNLNDFVARDKMMESSFLAGLAISKTRTSISHSISYPITAALRVPHGIACAVSIPTLIQYVTSHAPDLFNALIIELEMNSNLDLSNYVFSLLVEMGIIEKFKTFCKEPEAIFNLVPVMLDNDRSNNFMFSSRLGDLRAELIEPMVDQLFG
jgi:phosphonate metabolism-associated iron-containing alcohol dehydrogenase